MRYEIEEIVVALSSGEKQALWMAIQAVTQDRVVAGGHGISRHRLTLPQTALCLRIGHPASRPTVDQEGDGEQGHRKAGAGQSAGPREKLAVFAFIEAVQDDDRPFK